MNILREELSKRCLIVRGFLPGTDPQFVNNIFQDHCRRIQHKEGTTWLILFHNPQQASHFSYPGNIAENFPLHITQSTLSDIPDNWLQDQENQGSQPGQGQQFQPPTGAPFKSPIGDILQVVPSDPISLESKFYMNYPNITMEVKERRRSSSVDSINKSSDFVSVSDIGQEETSDVTSRIKVSSLPPNITDELITDYFENSKRSGGGDVESVVYDEKNNTAIITFQDPAVVRGVLKKHETKSLSMDEMQLQIEEYHPKTDESEDEVVVMAVKVTNLPPKIRKLQIELFFESPKKSGSRSEDLEKVEYDEAAHCAIVWFKDSEVITKVMEKHKSSPFTLNNQRVKVEEYLPIVDEDEDSSEEKEEGGGLIKVTKIPSEITKEEIIFFFENRKKSGGGDVEKVDYDKSTHTAIIWFKEYDVISRVLQKHPLLLRNKQIHVKEIHWDGQKVEKETVEVMAVKVTKLPPEISKEQIVLFFESHRKSGSESEDLEKVEYDEAAHCAILWFTDPEVVTKVLEKHKTSPFMMNKQKVEVEEYHPALDESSSEKEDDYDSTFEPLDEWSTMQDSDNLVVIPVNSDNPDHSSVTDRFQGHVGKREIDKAKLISDNIQWYYVDNSEDRNELIEYPGNINLTIEKAYRNQDKEVKFTDDGGTEYAINFTNMEEYPIVDRSDVITVTRRDKIKDYIFEPPAGWSAMQDSDNLAVVTVNFSTSEYSSVIDRFHGQVGKREIVKLERIQNKMLYAQYVAKKKLLESQNPKGTQNERELWHGTAPEAVSSINSLGFNRSYCGKNATAYGEGVYFAVNACYSASDTYSRPDKQRLKRMYLCKVLTGEFTQGKVGMRVPPAKQGKQSHILYDSVVNNMSIPAMFIIFNATQGYPDYLITFK